MFFVDSRFCLAFLWYSTISVVQLFVSALCFFFFFFLICGPLHEYITVCPFSCWLILCLLFGVSSVQLFSGVRLCNPMDCSTPDFPVHHQLLRFAQTHIHTVSDAFQPSHLLSSPSPAFTVSQHQGFSQESVLRIRWPKYWNFNFSISPSNEYSALISVRIDWLDLLTVQGTLKSPLQHHSSSINSLMLSFPYSPTLTSIHDYWKNHSFD